MWGTKDFTETYQKNWIRIKSNHSQMQSIYSNWQKQSCTHTPGTASYINVLLFQNNKYCFGYDDTLLLFDKIINRFECVPYKIKHCIQCTESAHEYFGDAGCGGLVFERQQKQSVVTDMIKIDDNYNIVNKDIFDIILSQNKTNRNKFINKCKHFRI